MLIKRAFKFKLKPTNSHREFFSRFAGARRFVFNRGLDQRQKSYEACGKSPNYFGQNKELTALKEDPETSWLKEIHSQVLQQGLKDLDRAFNNFFRRVKNREKPGFPKFKKKGIRDSFRYPQGVTTEGSDVYLPKIGKVKYRKSREIQGTIKETTILQEGTDWYISFSCEWEKEDPKLAVIDEEKAIGIDVGLNYFATLASGKENELQTIGNPRFLKKQLLHLRYLSRQLSKKTQKSQNRLKSKIKLSRLHAKIKNLRNDFVQQLSAKMVKTHDIFCVENLDITSLLKESPKSIARAIGDVGWRAFLQCLKYKAEERGKYFVEAGKYFASSQICSTCGHQKQMPLFEREYICQNCGIKKDRDYNSAIILKAAGMSVLKACGAALIGESVEAGISRL